MNALAVMWEARATDGRGPELLAWATACELPGERRPSRREAFTAPGDRVLVITWWPPPDDATVPELPDPPAELLSRPVHRWRFASVSVTGA